MRGRVFSQGRTRQFICSPIITVIVIFLPKYQPIYDCRLHWGIKKGEGRKTVHSWLLETPADMYFNILNYTLVSWNKPYHHLKYPDQLEAYYFHSLPVSASLQPACEVYSSGCRTSLTTSPLEWTQTPCAEEQSNYFSVHSRKPSSKLSKCHSGGPFPVKHFRERENVGVGEDHRNTSCLQHIAEGSLAKTGPPQNHAERGILWRHIGENG